MDNYRYYEDKGAIRKLPDVERETYVQFHKDAYSEDYLVATRLTHISPRWSIISGYYAMHDITKLYLSKKHGLKLGSPEIHSATIEALKRVLTNEVVKEKAIKLLREAGELYDLLETPNKEKIIHKILEEGKGTRGKAQYYNTGKNEIFEQKAKDFLDTYVKKYLELFEKMLEE